MAPGGPCIDILDAESRRFDRGLCTIGGAFVAQRQTVELFPVKAHQPRGKGRAAVLHAGGHRPVFLRPECFDLALALNDQAQRHRLHAARRFRAGQFAPQHRRERKAKQVVQRAPGEIGIDQILIELARLRHRGGHGRLGDGVERDSLHILGQDAALGQQFAHMPRNRFTLAIRVGRENQTFGALGCIGDSLDPRLFVGIEFPIHREVFIWTDRAILDRQVADVPIRCENLVAGTEILLDRLGFGRGFNDDQLHGRVPNVLKTGWATCTYTRGWGKPWGAVK